MWRIFKDKKQIALGDAIAEVYDNSMRYAKNYVGNHAEAEDIMHNVLEKILRKDKKEDKEFFSIEQFSYYVNLGIKNKFLDNIRKKSIVNTFDPETLDTIFKMYKSDIRTDQVFIDEYNNLVKEQKKIKVNSSKSHLSPVQYLVMTLRMNDYSFKEIAEFTGSSINTVLGQMRYSKGNFKNQFEEERVREKRRKRFREGREGQFDYEELLLKLPPYQYLVVKMKRSGIRFEDIAKLENAPTSTIYYRFLWAKKNLRRMVKSDEDYDRIIEYLDSLNTNTGGRCWHKDYEKRKKVTSKTLIKQL